MHVKDVATDGRMKGRDQHMKFFAVVRAVGNGSGEVAMFHAAVVVDGDVVLVQPIPYSFEVVDGVVEKELDDLEHPELDEGVQQVGQQHPQEMVIVTVVKSQALYCIGTIYRLHTAWRR